MHQGKLLGACAIAQICSFLLCAVGERALLSSFAAAPAPCAFVPTISIGPPNDRRRHHLQRLGSARPQRAGHSDRSPLRSAGQRVRRCAPLEQRRAGRSTSAPLGAVVVVPAPSCHGRGGEHPRHHGPPMQAAGAGTGDGSRPDHLRLAALFVSWRHPTAPQAYQFTSITSVALLDCFTVPACMVLTWLAFGCVSTACRGDTLPVRTLPALQAGCACAQGQVPARAHRRRRAVHAGPGRAGAKRRLLRRWRRVRRRARAAAVHPSLLSLASQRQRSCTLDPWCP